VKPPLRYEERLFIVATQVLCFLIQFPNTQFTVCIPRLNTENKRKLRSNNKLQIAHVVNPNTLALVTLEIEALSYIDSYKYALL
jgi:hypothetical protein